MSRAFAEISPRVLRGLRALAKKHGGVLPSIDYLVVGGGYAGCNAVSALTQAATPGTRVLCASLSPPGGSWYDYYDYAKLHAPHPQFGVSGQAWDIDDPNVLATRGQVIRHFNQYVDTLPSGYDFASGVEFLQSENDCGEGVSLADRVGQGVRATLRDVESGEEAVVSAKHLIDARGYFFKGHRRREEDLNFHSSDVQETQVAEVSAKLAEAKVDNGASSPRLYVVIGGGKTGLDTVLHISRQMRQGVDEVMLVTGRSKLFLRRDTVFPPYEKMALGELSPFTLGEIKLDLTLGWDGTNEEDLLRQVQDRGIMFALNDRPSTSSFYGCVSDAEKEAVEACCSRILQDDYFLSCEPLESGKSNPASSNGHRLTFQHAPAIETNRDVVLVNCRSSIGSDSHHGASVHPLRPDGTLRFGSLAGFTGPSHYLFSTLLAKRPEALGKLQFYGHKCVLLLCRCNANIRMSNCVILSSQVLRPLKTGMVWTLSDETTFHLGLFSVLAQALL
eukprot:INCI18096.4.p1 GENE.INCI18096.4~~INCI18096.4.p1  ORF type:complete len:504 (+),score=57.97 INCI18096.4:230-1741(+)